jgi:hypothetical protein
LDGGAVFGGRLRGYVDNKGIVEINAKRTYELDKIKRPASSSTAVSSISMRIVSIELR